MNDSTWGAPQGAGYWGTPEMRAAPAGPAHDVHGAQQTRPMPNVPDVPDAGRDAQSRDDRDRDAAHVSGPLFRDEKPQEPMSTPLPPPPQKKRAGRDLRAAIGVGVGLGAVIGVSLFIVKAAFIGVIVAAVVVGLWELTTRLQERKGIKAPLVPLAVGGAAMVIMRLRARARGGLDRDGPDRPRGAGMAYDRAAGRISQGRHGRGLRGVLRTFPGHLRRPDADGGRRVVAGPDLPHPHRGQRHGRVRGRLALRYAQARPAHQPRQDPRGTAGRGRLRDGQPARCAWSS